MTLNPENCLTHNSVAKTLYESDLDDENFSSVENYGIRERRRKLHTEAEQRRRNAIKRGFEGLLELVHPMKSESTSNVRMSKSSILSKAITMIERLGKQKHQKLSEVESLEKEVKALRILCLNYEKMVQNNPDSGCRTVEPISDETKLEVFRMFSGALFSSFEDRIAFSSFSDLSASVINWIEESCKPEKMAFVMDSVLASILNQNNERSSVGCRTFHFGSVPNYSGGTNDGQSYCNSMGPKHSSAGNLLQINLLGSGSLGYSYPPNNFQIPTHPASGSPALDSEKCDPHLKPVFPVQSPNSSVSDQVGIIQSSSESQGLFDLKFRRPGPADICAGSGFYNFGPFIPKNINSVVDESSLSTDTIITDTVSSHKTNSSCGVAINDTNLSKELSLHNSSHMPQYKQFIDNLL
uniref:BHLH domain-containing protein n=1 Tax=Trichobilharzia regenti TaxID=157069 RepID=A0AA85K672_TRIRE|nr:unnamed protein product [Trichobilharzia regenti]